MAKFSKEEKLVTVKRYLVGEGSLRGIADFIDVDPGSFRTWLKRFEYRGEAENPIQPIPQATN
ncbi:transposase [Jeotgalibacillus marinus]|uniref:Transposase n=1 Tax=Jeotgalibacillus marinus TaxID=86667 RepID=A0ABV3Q4Q5_9BACL